MISPEVGLETLPNCYIKMIEIDKGTPFSDRIDCTIILKDLQDSDGDYSWYKNDYLFPHMKILSVISADDALNSAIDSGQIPFSIAEINKLGQSGFFETRQESLSKFKQIITNEQNVEEGMLKSFNYPVSFQAQASFQNLKLYVAVVVDIQEFSSLKMINLSSDSLKVYRGPVSSETIKLNGKLQSKSSLLRKSSGEIWSGPVHVHEGRLMEGSFHTNDPHESLQEVVVENPKIKNYKQEKFQRLSTNRIQRNNPIFSDLITSYGAEGNVSNLFTVNIKSAVLRNSFYADKIASLNKSIFESMIDEVEVLNLTVSKQKIKTRKSQNKLGTSKRVPQIQIQFRRLITSRDRRKLAFRSLQEGNVSLEEIIMNSDVSERTFSFNEGNIYKEASENRYKINLVLSDPFKDFLDDLNTSSKQALKDLKTYVYRANIKSLNTEGSFLSPTFVEQEILRYPRKDTAPWNKATANYVSLVSTLRKIESDEIEPLIQESIFLIHPSYSTKKSVDTFLAKFSNVYMEFIKTYRLSQRSYLDTSKRGSAKNALNPKIELSKTFQQIVSYSGRAKCIHYLQTESEKFPLLAKEDLDRITQAQTQKHFKNQPSFAGTVLSDQSKELVEAFSDYKNNVISYINPITIQDKKEVTPVDDYKSIDLDRLNKIVDEFVPPVRTERVERPTPKPSNLSFKVAKDSKTYLADKKEKFKTTKQNLGENSPFRDATEQFEEKKARVVNNKIKKAFKKREIEKPSKKSFSLKEPKVSQKLEKNLKLVKRMPISLKSVFISESSNVKNNFIKKDDSFIENTKTSNAFRVAFQSPAKVEFLSGYSRDKNGDKILIKPQWKLLNKENFENLQGPVICRLSYHELKDLTNPLNEFYIANDQFILKDINQRIQKTPVVFDLPSSQRVSLITQRLMEIKIEYATSNIIKQYQNNINLRKINEEPENQQNERQTQTIGRLYR